MIPFYAKISQYLIKKLSARTYRSFIGAINAPWQHQENLLKDLIAMLANTEYGQSLQINQSLDYQTFKKKVPIVTYDDIEPWIENSKSRSKCLTSESIDFFELTSGSTGARKAIPYTASLRKDFSHAFQIWYYDCLQHQVKLGSGRTFISISPQPSSSKRIETLIQNDADYLQGVSKFLVSPFLVNPPNLYQIKSPTDFQFVIALYLLAESQLEVISIWSPSYFIVILEVIQNQWHHLLSVLESQFYQVANINFKLNVTQQRLNYLSSLCPDTQIEAIWPNLQMISCWGSGVSEKGAKWLQAYFPNRFLQYKGLLATEAPLTIPLIQAGGFLPLLQYVFFEFEDGNGNILTIDQVQVGEIYQLIITQSGGLYRYRMEDRVKVTGFYGKTPMLDFIGRTAKVVDMVGEKLNSDFVGSILLKPPYTKAAFAVLVPQIKKQYYGQYSLITNCKHLLSHQKALEDALCQSFHYKAARHMQQLFPAQVHYCAKAQMLYQSFYESKGIKIGDQKEQYLITDLTIAAQFMNQIAGHISGRNMA